MDLMFVSLRAGIEVDDIILLSDLKLVVLCCQTEGMSYSVVIPVGAETDSIVTFLLGGRVLIFIV
jgi:hypothetical protein